MADIDWSDLPRLVIGLEFEPIPIEIITIAAWPYITTVIPLNTYYTGMFSGDQLVPREGYPYVTDVYLLSDFSIAGTTPINVYIGGSANTGIIPLEFQPLPIPVSTLSGSSINIVLLGCADLPTEFWG